MIAFFIDADNLCAPKWIDEAFEVLESSVGVVSVRRAYGSAEKLRGLAEICRTRSIRPFVNLTISKNTTDVALAVDVMALSFQTPCPSVVAIGSGDVDFLPLVVRLRERGVKVICVSERGKMSPEAISSYETVIYVGESGASETNSATQGAEISELIGQETAPVRKTAAKAPKAVSSAAKATPSPKAPAKKVAKQPTKRTAATSLGEVKVDDVLKAVPQLRDKDWLSLNTVAKQLRDKKLLAKSTSSAKLFGKYPHHFSLDPKQKPTKVRYIR